jgi:hypothetical protein
VPFELSRLGVATLLKQGARRIAIRWSIKVSHQDNFVSRTKRIGYIPLIFVEEFS